MNSSHNSTQLHFDVAIAIRLEKIGAVPLKSLLC